MLRRTRGEGAVSVERRIFPGRPLAVSGLFVLANFGGGLFCAAINGCEFPIWNWVECRRVSYWEWLKLVALSLLISVALATPVVAIWWLAK
jgi:hypothetical protein